MLGPNKPLASLIDIYINQVVLGPNMPMASPIDIYINQFVLGLPKEYMSMVSPKDIYFIEWKHRLKMKLMNWEPLVYRLLV